MAERDLVTGIVQLANVLTRRLAPLFEKAHITPQQWAVLSVIGGADEPLTLAGIGREMLVSKQNMTGMVARLEQLGLVERAGDPNDLRSSRVQLTRRGRTVVEKLQPTYEQWLRNVGQQNVSERDIQGLTRTVNKLIDVLESGE